MPAAAATAAPSAAVASWSQCGSKRQLANTVVDAMCGVPVRQRAHGRVEIWPGERRARIGQAKEVHAIRPDAQDRGTLHGVPPLSSRASAPEGGCASSGAIRRRRWPDNDGRAAHRARHGDEAAAAEALVVRMWREDQARARRDCIQGPEGQRSHAPLRLTRRDGRLRQHDSGGRSRVVKCAAASVRVISGAGWRR